MRSKWSSFEARAAVHRPGLSGAEVAAVAACVFPPRPIVLPVSGSATPVPNAATDDADDEDQEKPSHPVIISRSGCRSGQERQLLSGENDSQLTLAWFGLLLMRCVRLAKHVRHPTVVVLDPLAASSRRRGPKKEADDRVHRDGCRQKEQDREHGSAP